MLDTASALLGEPAVLYKEKINYKLAGGAGYTAHQDAPAYRFVEQHISCMVAIDDATLDNGCLEVASGMHAAVLPMDETGCIRDDVASALQWTPVELRAGQTLWFHSRTPHRSGPNRSAVAGERSIRHTTRCPRATCATTTTGRSRPSSPPTENRVIASRFR